MTLVYRCENDDCEEGVVNVGRDGEATCPTCGWFMVGVGELTE